MTSEFVDQKNVIDPTESISAQAQKLDVWTRRGTPLRVLATSDVTLDVDSWDLVSSPASNTALAEVILSETANTDINLPAVADNLGRQIIIKNIGAASTDVNADGSDLVDGGATLALSAGESATLIAAEVLSNTPEWYVV